MVNKKTITPWKGSWAEGMEKKTMSNDLTLGESLQQGFNLLKGWKYRDLNIEQRRTLYAYLLWQDGASEETAVDSGMHSDPRFVDDQLRTSFGYENESVIA